MQGIFIAGPRFQRFFVSRDRFFKTSEPGQGIAAVVVGGGILKLGKVFDRGIKITCSVAR